MKPPRVLFVGHSAHMAGAEYSLYRIIRSLGKTVQAEVLAPSGGEFEKRISELSLPFFSLNPHYAFRFKKDKGGVLHHYLHQLLEQTEHLFNTLKAPDIIHSNTVFIWEGALLAAKWNIPHVWNLREIPRDSPTWQPLIELNSQYELMNLFSDAFACVSMALQDSLPDSLQKKSKVIHNGLDKKNILSKGEAKKYFFKEFGIDEGSQVLLTVGNFIPEKGHGFLLRLVDAILKDYPEVVFLWVGQHHMTYSKISEAIQSLENADRIITPGHVPSFGNYMAGADLYLLSSETEAFPTVVLEAILAEVPVVARDCGGVREILNTGGGWTIPLHDVSAFDSRIRKFLSEEVKTPISQVEAFSEREMSGKYLSLYKGTIHKWKPELARGMALRGINSFAEEMKVLVTRENEMKKKLDHPLLRILKRIFG